MSFTYRGLKGQLERHIVTGEEIDRQIQRLQQQNPRVASVQDRATQLGDEVVLDYAGFCNGEQFAGGTAQGQTLVLGSGMFIPGFEEHSRSHHRVEGQRCGSGRASRQLGVPRAQDQDRLSGSLCQAGFLCRQGCHSGVIANLIK